MVPLSMKKMGIQLSHGAPIEGRKIKLMINDLRNWFSDEEENSEIRTYRDNDGIKINF